MPNLLMQNISSSQSFGVPLIDPYKVRAARRRFKREKIDDLDRANSLYVMCGRFPARGWVLIRRADLNQFNVYQNVSLQIDDENDFTGHFTLQGLVIVQSRCVTRGMANDPNAIYLVELTDQRGILYNRWFQYPTSPSQFTFDPATALGYNVRAPGYPAQYYLGTIPSASTPWTWTGMIGDLWGQMGAFLGPYPGLPFTPTGTPEGWWMPGTGAFNAMCDVLDYLGLTISVDLRQANPYQIVQIGAVDPIFSALTAKYLPIKEDDHEWVDAGSGRSPGSVIVKFHTRQQFTGTEETVRNDVRQWTTNSAYPVTVAGPAPLNQAPGVHYLWADFTVEIDRDGVPLPADVTTAAAIAQERVTQYYAKITRGQGYLNRLYSGVVPFVTGSQLDGVSWRQTRAENPEQRRGYVTEVLRGPSPAWPEIYVETGN